MKIALAQINPIIGDIHANAQKIRRSIIQSANEGAKLVVFPELAIIGYPPKDLLLKPSVIATCQDAVNELATVCQGISAIIGLPHPNPHPTGRPLYNAAAMCHEGKVIHRYTKNLLPTYDVFDEHRYFEPGGVPNVIRFDQTTLGVTICEDLWNDQTIIPHQLYHEDPVHELAKAGANFLVNCSASPFTVGKHELRKQLLTSAAKRHNLPIVFCNQVGGNDELIFDGNSFVVDHTGQLIAHARGFHTDLLFADVPLTGDKTITSNRIEVPQTGVESAYHALTLGLTDYCHKCGFSTAVLGLSGGIDSAVTAALAVAALGEKNVRAVAMPSRYSSEGSLADAKSLADRLNIRLDIVPIDPVHQTFEQLLIPKFEGKPPDATEENIQARIRGIILMGLSNKFGSLLVTTGNKSELAVGYCTLYGDMAGGLAVLSDVPKTMVFELARWMNESPASPLRKRFHGAVIPENTLIKPPSAELRPNQIDQDSLPPYDILDHIIEQYVEQEMSIEQIMVQFSENAEFSKVDKETVVRVVRLIDQNEYKRQQAAPGLKITGRAFGFGRRMPIAQRWNNTHRD